MPASSPAPQAPRQTGRAALRAVSRSLPAGLRTKASDLADDRRTRRAVRALERHGGLVGIGLLGLAVGVGAVLVPGVRAADEHLDDQAVYVANGTDSLLGLVNPQITRLAQVAPIGGQTQFGLWQDGQEVVVEGTASNQLQRYTPATNTLGAPMNLPAGAQVNITAGRLAVTNQSTGKVWFRPVSEIKDDLSQARPALDVGERGLAVVTASGQLVGLDVRESRLVRAGASEEEQRTEPVDLGLSASSRRVQLSAVGEQAVVYDESSRAIWREGGSATDLAAQGRVVLANPLPEVLGNRDWHALFATETGLSVLDGGGVRALADLPQLRGTPARPVVRGECAWTALQRSSGESIGTVVRYCRGQDPVALDVELPDAPAEPRLQLVVNRNTIALNETVTGRTWIVGDSLRPVPQTWQQLSPAKEVTTSQVNDGVADRQRTRKQHPPVANDDRLGARAGRSTLLDVTGNDFDPDGDVVTVVEAPQTLEGGITVQKVRGGAALQVLVPSGTPARQVSFTYKIGDGYPNQTDQARVNLAIAGADASQGNRPPVLTRKSRVLSVGQNSRASLRALLDWSDPEGDDLVLVDAVATDPDDEVAFTPDGTVTYRALGTAAGPRFLKLTVSDGAQRTDAKIRVNVTQKAFPPVANADHYQTRVGVRTLLTPTDNDEGEGLKLGAPGAVTRAGAATVEAGSWKLERKQADNALFFTATVPGTWYLTYPVTSSTGGPSEGTIRVDVAPRSQSNAAPVAARDVALVTAAGDALTDPLANDSDPDGDVLVVQSVEAVDPSAPVTLELQQRQFVRVKANRRLERPVQLRYWLSDGVNSVPGTIMVVPAGPAEGRAQPVALPDELRVRAGTTGSVDVLANDHSPLGLDLHLVKLTGAGPDRAWVDGKRVRVATSPSPDGSSIPLNYVVADDQGNQSTGVVNVLVSSSDGKNDAPSPQLVEARVLAGSSNRIRIPLDGIDPDGDPVRLVGIASAPRLGRVTQTGDGYLVYEAFPGSRRTDTFKYRVMDAKGADGTGEVRVGIAERRTESTPPTAVADRLAVRPGRAVQWPVLANDHDVDGDAISLASAESVELPFATTITNRTDLSFTAPTKEGEYSGTYLVRDTLGLNSRGALGLTVSAKAPLHAPVARDDVIPATAIEGKEWIQVQAVRNDFDVDGRARDLTMGVPQDEAAQGVETQPDGSLRVPVQRTTRQFRYQVTDADGLTSEAVVTVPGRDNQLPTLRVPQPEHVVTAGETLQLDLNQLAVGTQGRKLVVRSADDVYGTSGPVMHDRSTLRFTPGATTSGPAAVVVNVTEDVPVEQGPRSAWLTIPVTVRRAPVAKTDGKQDVTPVNLPPRGRVPEIVVSPGEPEIPISLSQYFADQELQDFHFEGWRAASGGEQRLQFRFNDTQDTLYVRAPHDLAPGGKRRIEGEVVDAAGARARTEITLVAGKSPRPVPLTGVDSVERAEGGHSYPVDVLANDRSFIKADPKLRLVGTPSLVQGKGSARIQGDRVVVTPDAGFHGLLVVAYTVQDATNDPSRQVDGQVKVTVVAAPEPPGTPTVSEVGDASASVAWREPAANGAPITRYTVVARATGMGASDVKQECTATPCRITRLTNDVTYTVQVVATNEVGDSNPSRPSASFRPDTRPEPPVRLVTTAADEAVTIQWEPGPNKGSAIQRYEVSIKGPGAQQTVDVGTRTSHRFTGLSNGAGYTFRVRAWNKYPEPSLWTNWTDAAYPVGAPGAPGAVQVSESGESGRVVQLGWEPPQDTGGTPITAYTLQVVVDGRTTNLGRVDGERTTFTWDEASRGDSHVFRVVAHNKVGAGPAATSAPFTPWGRPPAPTDFTMRPGRNSVTLTSLGDKSSVPVASYRFWAQPTNGGTPSEAVTFSAGDPLPTIGGLEAGQAYEGRLVAISTANGESRTSAVGETRGSVTPWGAAPAPGLDVGAVSGPAGTIGYRVRKVSDEALDRAGVAQVAYQVQVGGGGWQGVQPDQEQRIGVGSPTTIQVRVVDTGHDDAAGNESAPVSVESPMQVWQDAATKKVQVRLAHWPGEQVTCSLETGGQKVSELGASGSSPTQYAFEWLPPAPADPAAPPPDNIPYSVTCASASVTQTASDLVWKQAP